MNPHHTTESIERSCANLARDGQPITCAAIDVVTGISRSTFNRNAGIRAIIEHDMSTSKGQITAITDEVATLRATVTTIADPVRSHEEQLRN